MAEEEKTINETISTEEEARMINVSKKRVYFKVHFAIFFVINLIVWVLWFMLFNTIVTDAYIGQAILKAFLCVTLVWLLLVILHYLIAYKWNKTFIEKELSKIRKQRDKPLTEIEKIKAKIAEMKNQQNQPE